MTDITITADERNALLRMFRDIDIQSRPYAIYCHPDDAEVFRAAVGEDKYKIVPNSFVDKGTVLVVDRALTEVINEVIEG